MLSEHWGRIGELSENLNKETRTIKKSQSEMRTTITEIKDTLKGIDSQINEPKDWISDLEDKVEANTHSEQKT